MEVAREADYADGDQIDGYDIVEQARHEQDENTSDQSDQRIDQDWVKGQRSSPVK